jgi:hypothetical protein
VAAEAISMALAISSTSESTHMIRWCSASVRGALRGRAHHRSL